MRAAIRKSGGIEEVLGRFDTSQVEVDHKPEIVGENKFSDLLLKYKGFLDSTIGGVSINYHIHGSNNVTEILTPDEINAFLLTTIPYEEVKEYKEVTGVFITRLIQNSYNAGNNDFHLDTRSLTKNLYYLGAVLKGKKNNKIQISITGDVGNRCGFMAKNSTYTITGNVGHLCGKSANNSAYTITGDVGGWCGYRAKNSTFNITGDVGYGCGLEAKYSTYNITGDVGVGCGTGAKYSTFKTPNKETLKKLQESVYRGNKIIYVKKDGTEQVIR